MVLVKRVEGQLSVQPDQTATLGSLQSPPAVLHAYAVFTRTPATLYRTVEVNDLLPAVLTNHAGNPISRLVPLECVGAEDEVDVTNPSHWFQGPHISGISLRSTHPTKDLAAHVAPGQDPWKAKIPGPSTTKDPRSHEAACMDLRRLPPPPADVAVAVPSEYGCLASSMFCQSKKDGTLIVRRGPVELDKQGRKVRKGYVCYSLPHGTDLGALRSAAVFDNEPPGHFSLVPWGAQPPVKVFWPANEERICSRPIGARSSPGAAEYFVSSTGNYVFPLVAQCFQAHCLQTFGAKAEPSLDLLGDGGNAAVCLAAGHALCAGMDQDHLDAYDALAGAGFVLARVQRRWLERMLGVLSAMLSDEEEDDELQVLLAEAVDDLRAAIDERTTAVVC